MTGNTASDIIYLSAKAIYTWVTGLFISPVFTGTGSGNFNGFANAYVIPANVGGTANAITLTPSPAITTYQEGQEFLFDAKATNTIVSPTIAINGLTPVLLTTMGSVALPIG